MDPRQLAEHLRFYSEIGVTGISRDAAWRRRLDSEGAGPDAESAEANREGAEGRTESAGTPALPPSVPALVASAPALPASAPAHLLSIPAPSASVQAPSGSSPLIWNLTSIREDIGDCTRCKLATLGRQQVVFGVGNSNADLMFVGEAPGADEDLQGVPFVGRAGQLLTKMIEAMGFTRDDVYIANVVKCRPPENRNPDPDEIESCEPFLFRQIETIKPKVIVALGAFAAKTLLRSQEPISKLRGNVYDYHGAQLIPTFHPSFLLRSPGQKKFAWEDLKRALSILAR